MKAAKRIRCEQKFRRVNFALPSASGEKEKTLKDFAAKHKVY